MIVVLIFWLIISILFAYLGYHHWRLRHRSMPHLHMEKYGNADLEAFQTGITVDDLNTMVGDFVVGFNGHVDGYNRESKSSNTAQAVGYWLASLTAIASAILALVN